MNLIGKGAVERPWDIRNISYSAFFPDTGGSGTFDWSVGFDLSKEVPFLIKNQDGSSSCVGQGWSYYAEALNFKETGVFTSLSPKFVYSRIFLDGGGAYGYKGADIMEKLGIGTELSVPSYENGNVPPGESFMELIDSRPEVMTEALTYRGKNHAYVAQTFDAMAQAIRNQYGMVGGITGSNQGVSLPKGIIRPPLQSEALWGHWLYFVGAMMINEKKYLKFINSWSDQWGDAGFGYVGEDYLPFMFNSITLLDLPNDYLKPMTLVMLDGGKDIWLVRDGKRSLIYNVSAFKLIGGNIDQVQKLTVAQFDAIPDSGTVLAGIPQE